MNNEYISIGSNCCNGMAIKSLNLKKYSLPFDSVVSSPKIIYHCLKTNFDHFLEIEKNKNFNGIDDSITDVFERQNINLTELTNKYGIFFNHYTHLTENELINIFKRRINRFYEILSSSNNIYFIYSTELCIYSKKIRDMQDENYKYLIKIEEFLLENYKNLNFKILSYNFNKDYLNTNNIINFKINIDNTEISDFLETHHPLIYDKYREKIKIELDNYIKKLF